MIRKIGFVGVLMSTLSLPLGAYGQAPSRSEDINTANVPQHSFVIISEEETEIPGYVHQKYAYISQGCPAGFQVIDYYGAPLDLNDASLLVRERALCADSSWDTPDD